MTAATSVMYLMAGLVLAFNVIVIMQKIRRGRYFDALIDGAMLITFTYVLSGSFGGVVVGSAASLFMSIYLWVLPPQLSLFRGMGETLNKRMQEEGIIEPKTHTMKMVREIDKIKPKSLSTPMRTVMLLAENKLQKAHIEMLTHQGDSKYLEAFEVAKKHHSVVAERTRKLATVVAGIYGK